MALLIIVGLAPPAITRPSRFTGAAPGSVTSALSANVSFSPHLKVSGGGTGSSVVAGKLSRCVASSSAVKITTGVVTGSFAASPFSCSTLSSVSAAATLHIAWKRRSQWCGRECDVCRQGEPHEQHRELQRWKPRCLWIVDAWHSQHVECGGLLFRALHRHGHESR